MEKWDGIALLTNLTFLAQTYIFFRDTKTQSMNI